MFKTLRFDIQDAMTLAGVAAFTYGLYQIYTPAAWLFAGFVLFKMGTSGGD